MLRRPFLVRSVTVLAVMLWAGGQALPAAAATAELRLLLDLDNDSSTGCGVATADGPFPGVEQILLTTVETTDTTAMVVAVERQVCTNPGSGTFGPRLTVDLSGWPVGIGNGLDATHVVETLFPLSVLGETPATIRLGLIGLPGGRTQDALIVTQPGGETEILLDLGPIAEIEIPTLGTWGFLVLALLLGAVALALLRRRTAAAALLGIALLGVSATVWAVCLLDGEITDWTGVDPLAEDALADGPAGADLRALFGKRDGDDLCFRFDTDLVFDVATPNQSPVVDAATFGVGENSADGTSVGTVTFTDPDAGQTHTFAITAGNTDGAFAIDPTSGEITVAGSAALDFETNPSFALTVEVTDDGVPPLTGSATVTVDLSDVNETPVVADQAFAVAENSSNGTSVGTVAFTDPDAGQTHAFAITAGNIDGAFAIDPATGEITVANNAAIDTETNPSFALTVEVTDDGAPPLTGSATVTVTVTDQNEPPVANDAAFSVDENSADGTSVGTVTFTDSDAGQTHAFAINAGNTGGAFAINASTGEITVANSAAVDFETNPSFSLTVEVSDDGTPPLSDTATVTITVNDLNEAPTVSDQAFSVDENAANGTSVGNVIASDEDVPAQTLTFVITGGNAGGAFAINSSTGEITVANSAALDSEVNPGFSLTVEVTDDGTPPLTSSATVTVTVNDLNEAPTVNAAAFSIDENSANGTSVGTVTFNDPDTGQTHAFAITAGNTGGAFAIHSSTGEITVANSAAVDFETNPSFSLTVEVTDDGTPPLTGSATVTIDVTDQNEAPAVDAAAFSIDENSSNGASVGTVTFTDPDAGQTHNFAITAGNTGGAFAINSSTGEITVANSAAVDFETNPSFSLTVEVTDDGTPPLAGSATVAITVNDLNEAPTVNAATFMLAENSANGTGVGTVTFTDPDAGQTHAFAITAGNTGGAFAINSSTGEITVANSAAVNFETDPSFSLTVEVTDDGTPPLTGSATITVDLTNVNEPPDAVDDPSIATDEDTPITILVLANDTDPDAGDTLTIINVAGASGAVINNGTDLSYDPTVAFNSLPQGGMAVDSFTYTIQDTGGLQDTATVTVTIGGLNDDPIADDETYSAIGNTQLAVAKIGPFGDPTFSSSLADVLDGDVDPDTGDTLSAVVFSGALPSGATLDLAADGSFLYTPPAGQTLPDSFDYTVEDTFGGTDVGTVTINLAKMVWYVENTANGGVVNTGSGTSTDPFSTLSDGAANVAADDAEDASAAGHIVYVHQGSGTANQDQGFSLKNQQRLLGEGVSLVIDPDDGGPEPAATLFVGNPANRPHVTRTGAGDAVNVLADTANGNRIGIEIRGLQLSSASGNAIDVTSADAANLGVEISENSVSGAGLEGIDVTASSTSATQTLSIHDNSLLATGTALDVLRTAGTLTLTAFDDNTVAGNTVGSGLVVNGAIFDAVPGVPINTVAGGLTTIGQMGNGVGANGLQLTNVAGDLAFTDLDIWNDGGAGLRATSTGALNAAAGTGFRITVPASVGSIDSNGGPAVDISGASVTLPLGFLESTNSSTTGISLVNAFGGAGATALSASSGQIADPVGASGAAVSIAGGNGNVSLGIPITNTTGNAVSISSRTSDTVAFTGAISETGSGISLTSNTGATISFRGGLSASTGANPAFSATGGGNVEICDENPCNPGGTGLLVNTLTTTTGTALNVANTTITANNLELRSISAGTAGGGPTNGIALNATGANGGLRVKGTGAAGSGGTIRNSATGISLTNTRNVSLAWMQLNDFSDFAIRGSSVVGFSLSNSVINGVSGNNAASDEGAVRLTELTGSATVSGSNISGGFENNFTVLNTTGTLDRLTVTGTTFGANSTTDGDDSLLIEAQGTAVLNATVQSSFFTAAKGDLFNAALNGTGSMDIVFTGNQLSNNHPSIVAGSLSALLFGTHGTLTYEVSGNTMRDATGTALAVSCGNADSTCLGSLENNQIGVAATANSGSTGGSGIALVSAAGGVFRSLVNGNTVRQYNNHGILLQAGDQMGNPLTFQVTVTGNTVGNPGNINTNFNGIHLNHGTVGTDNASSCVDIRSNSIAGAGTGAVAPNNADFRLRQRQATTVRLPGYGGANNDDAAVVAFVSGQQTTVTTGAASNTVPTGGGFIGGAACTAP